MTTSETDHIRAAVRDRYADAARAAQDGTCEGPSGTASGLFGRTLYKDIETDALPSDALTASLGCGNPTMLADLQPGDVVLDLGSGGGIDVLLSARRVGPTGMAYGLDMTSEMLELARKNQVEAGLTNVEFLRGTIEDIPMPDETIDVVISNCVVNLSPDKDAVVHEAFRVLKPGGRLAISDIVLRRPLSEPTRQLIGLWTGRIAGALVDDDYQARLESAGFEEVSIEPTRVYGDDDIVALAAELAVDADLPDRIDRNEVLAELGGSVMSAFVRGRKPEFRQES
jgi:SAM-dependent methyltransferase